MKSIICTMVLLLSGSNAWTSECTREMLLQPNVKFLYPYVEFDLRELGTVLVPIIDVAMNSETAWARIHVNSEGGPQPLTIVRSRTSSKIVDGKRILSRLSCEFKASLMSASDSLICEKTMILKECN